MRSSDIHQAAVKAFKQGLLNSPLGNRIMKIILFGSWAKGTAQEKSDLDILVVANAGDGLSELIADLALEIQMEYQIGIEPVTISLHELFPLQSYFLFNTMSYGQEVYAVSGETLKTEERKNLLNLADEYLTGAEHAAEHEYWRLAIDAAYNAAELAVKSLILKLDDDLPGSHGGLVGRFGELYIKTGLYERALGRKLNQVLQLRNQARYKYQAAIKQDDADASIRLAKALMELGEKDLK
ncbi:HEPN domain-containing protein [Acidobacteria bacterium AH-259-G07]|nr:HEPN domain-containing protein [Acidobacteria bacterium AH-259-G07]